MLISRWADQWIVRAKVESATGEWDHPTVKNLTLLSFVTNKAVFLLLYYLYSMVITRLNGWDLDNCT